MQLVILCCLLRNWRTIANKAVPSGQSWHQNIWEVVYGSSLDKAAVLLSNDNKSHLANVRRWVYNLVWLPATRHIQLQQALCQQLVKKCHHRQDSTIYMQSYAAHWYRFGISWWNWSGGGGIRIHSNKLRVISNSFELDFLKSVSPTMYSCGILFCINYQQLQLLCFFCLVL